MCAYHPSVTPQSPAVALSPLFAALLSGLVIVSHILLSSFLITHTFLFFFLAFPSLISTLVNHSE